MASSQSTNQQEAEEYIWPHQAPLLERLTSQDEATVEDELNQDLGYPSLGGVQNRNWIERATDYGSRSLSWFRRNTRGRYEDWLFLVMLGGLMGLYSFGIDVAVMTANQYRLAAFKMAGDVASGVVIWLVLTAAVSTSAALFLAWFIPSATGSGFPEIKAYLQGVKMENTFSPLTCIGKLVFLPIMLCTALPLGKEGPVTHVAAVFALFITKVFKDVSVEELERHTGNELVAAACTMGAAVCYGAPVGGVLFSIESTRTYFAVRNYWRGFFAAVCGTVFYKGLSQIYHGIDILPMYQETYTMPLPFNFEFLGISVGIGLLCGLLGPLFVWTHRQLLRLIQRVNAMSPRCHCRCSPDRADAKGGQPSTCHLGLTKHKVTVFRLLYTIMVCVMMAAVILPWRDGYSPVMSHISTRQQMTDLMANVSWESALQTNDTTPCAPGGDSRNCSLPVDAADGDTEKYRALLIRSRWTDGFNLDYRAVLVLYMLFYFFGTMICTTLTLPSGTLIPIFKVGVAMGRLLGEFYCSHRLSVCAANSAVASGFACMCGAAMAASVTHSISISVIVFELTGQITYVLPVLTSVLVANALSRHLQPSMVDSLTSAKNITVLPKIVLSKIQGGYANIHARDLMTTQFVVVTRRATLNSLRKLVRCVQNPAKVLPLVDDEVNMEPLGLVHVRRVRRLLREELGNTAWQRDRPRFYLTLNAFKALDWESVRGNAAVGRLGLEVTPSFRASSGSPRPQRQRRASLERLDTIDPQTYCTVTSGTQSKVHWDLARQKLIQPKDMDVSSKPRRSAMRTSTGNGTTPLAAEGRTPDGDQQQQTSTKRSRFSVKKIPEASLESLPLAKLRKKEVLKGQQLNGVAENGVPSDLDDSGFDVLPLDGDSAASSDERPTDKVVPPPLDGRRRGRRRPLIESPLKGGEPSEVYDSLVSESSRAARLRDGIAKYISKRSGALDLESRQQNAQERLQRQFSISDLHEGENDGFANMGQLIQRTFDRTTQMFTGVANQKEQPETEVRLRRTWRRHQLNREVELRDVIEVDTFPLAVNVDTPLVQVHKMFAMLCANKMYVMDRRRLVGCLPLQRLSEFITRGHVDSQTPASGYDTVTDCAGALAGRRDSQDTLDEVSDSVYDTVTGTPRAGEQQETSAV